MSFFPRLHLRWQAYIFGALTQAKLIDPLSEIIRGAVHLFNQSNLETRQDFLLDDSAEVNWVLEIPS